MKSNAKTKSRARFRVHCERHRQIKRWSKSAANRIERRALNDAVKREAQEA